MIHMTVDCVRPTQSNVIQIIHRNVGLKGFFLSILSKCLFVIIIIYAYFIYIL